MGRPSRGSLTPERMTEQFPAPPPDQSAPSAPGFAEILEQSLAAVVDPGVFRRAAGRPAPSLGVSVAFALAAGAASLLISLAHALVSNPGFVQQASPIALTAEAAVILVLYAGATLLLAAVLYGAGNVFGGKGEFARGLQAAAMISALGPVQMLCNWFPLAWIVPALLAAWVAAGALAELFGARPWPARALCAALAVGALGLQAAGRAFTERTKEADAVTQAAQNTAIATEELSRSMAEFSRQAGTGVAGGPALAAPAPAASGLDLLRGPSNEAPAGALALAQTRTIPAAMAAPAQGLQPNVLGMLDAVAPMIEMLANTKNMPPEQKADLQELKSTIIELKSQISSGKKIDNAVFAERMARYQKLVMKLMAGGLAPPQREGR